MHSYLRAARSYLRAAAESLLFCVIVGGLLAVLAMFVGCDVAIDLGEEPAPIERIETTPSPIHGTQPPCPDGRCPYPTSAAIDLPQEFRQENYNYGSCMYASTITAMHRQGLHREAEYWRRNYSGGMAVSGLVPICESRNLRFAYTLRGDAEFLEWASRTSRGAAIHWKVKRAGDHAVYFYGYTDDGQTALVIDNNDPSRVLRLPKSRFLSIWRASGGQALTPVYSPMPPRPVMPGENSEVRS